MSTTWTQGANVRDVRAPALMTVRDANNKIVAFVADTDHMHLISAAPDLLKALYAGPSIEHALPFGNKCECSQCQFVRLRRAAIAKATGSAS